MLRDTFLGLSLHPNDTLTQIVFTEERVSVEAGSAKYTRNRRRQDSQLANSWPGDTPMQCKKLPKQPMAPNPSPLWSAGLIWRISLQPQYDGATHQHPQTVRQHSLRVVPTGDSHRRVSEPSDGNSTDSPWPSLKAIMPVSFIASWQL